MIRNVTKGISILVFLGACLTGAFAAEDQVPCYQYVYSPSLVKAIQLKLADAGYDPGPVDGHWGGKTQAALRRFQIDAGRLPSSELDEGTLRALFGGGFVPGGKKKIENPTNAPQDVFDKQCK